MTDFVTLLLLPDAARTSFASSGNEKVRNINEVVGENRVPSPDSFNVTGLLIGPVLSTWNVHACALMHKCTCMYTHVYVAYK